MAGLLLLFIAFLSDALGEVFKHPPQLTVILEDASELLGLVLLVLGVNRWIKKDDERHATLHNFAEHDALTGLFMH